jgi:hypothetical protein
MTKPTLVLALAVSACVADAPPRMPIPSEYDHSATARWLAKPVLRSELLDDAESLDSWKVENVDQAKGELSLTRGRAVSGATSLRLRCPTVGEKRVPTSRYYGTASARRVVNGEDWSEWNRLSFWVYPDLPGFRVVSLIVTFHNEGSEQVPDSYRKMGVKSGPQSLSLHCCLWPYLGFARSPAVVSRLCPVSSSSITRP